MNCPCLNYLAGAPIAILTIGAMIFLLLDLINVSFSRVFWGVAICALAWFAMFPSLDFPLTAFSGLYAADRLTFVFSTIVLGGTAFTLMLQDGALEGQKVTKSIDVDVMLLFAAAGGIALIAAQHLVVLFLALELLSISVYVLTALARGERASSEAALKYFILGSFSSALLLYGAVLIYGATGSMLLPEITKALLTGGAALSPMFMLGLGLLLFGFAFKVSLVPFHFWTPDVYQGAPTSVTMFMAVVVKAAAFGSFLRVFGSAFMPVYSSYNQIFWLLSILTMTIGNLVALRQQSVKRMLAYSSIAHAGYAMLGFLTLQNGGAGAVAFYMLVYAVMTIGSFGVLLAATLGTSAQYERDSFDSLAGFGWKRPWLGLAMTIAMLSLAGIPPLAGFMGKFQLFRAALSQGYTGIVIIAALNSLVSLYYYLRVPMVMYFKDGDDRTYAPLECGPKLALLLSTALVVYVGLFSEGFWNFAQHVLR